MKNNVEVIWGEEFSRFENGIVRTNQGRRIKADSIICCMGRTNLYKPIQIQNIYYHDGLLTVDGYLQVFFFFFFFFFFH